MLAVAKRTGLGYASVHAMLTKGGGNPKLAAVQGVCEVIGLELRPVRRKRPQGT